MTSSHRCDVLVIGAGPAGSAAAVALARHGTDVVLADRHAFPRDKACGDALIPDALDVLRRLGLQGPVLAEARRFQALDIYAPGGCGVRLHGPSACLPREALDETLRRAALAAGARFLGRHRLESALEDEGRITGAAFRNLESGTRVTVSARVTLLATGAAAQPLRAFGACTRVEPSAMAGRVYLQVDAALADEIDALSISFDRAICPGYGWIFPGPRGVLNVGVGFFKDGPPPSLTNLQHLLQRFVERFPPAARVWARGRLLGPMKGAPLRTGLRGARRERPGLLVTGEAAGLTYAFSGEGIGKAMEGALLAADLARDALAADAPALAALGPRYERALGERMGALFHAHDLAQRRLARPALADLLAARARPGSYGHRQLEAMFNETPLEGRLFSPWGLLRALVG